MYVKRTMNSRVCPLQNQQFKSNHSSVVIRTGFAKFHKDRDEDVRYLREDAPTRAKYNTKLDQLMAPEPSSSGR